MRIDASTFTAYATKSMEKLKADFDPAEKEREGSLKAILTRIKNARISRDLRDHYSKLVRTMAADDRLDDKLIKSILEIIFLLEMTSSENEKNEECTVGNAEKTVNDEMKQLR
ncbi:MAG TPA: hypothetical protein PLS19_08085, partial [bacterium]|nr:hypothetical protein [bacterium]